MTRLRFQPTAIHRPPARFPALIPMMCGILIRLLPIGPITCVWAAPQPGDVFREYRWAKSDGDAGGALRVGGRVGYGGGPIALAHDFDLDCATRIEVVVEKLLCHDGTRDLAISINGHDWIALPEAGGIPAPQWDYQHHTYPIAKAPLGQIQAGTNNQFRMRVGQEHPWNWPQNLVYGVHFRVYYDPASKPHPTGRLVSPDPNSPLGVSVDVQAEASSPNGQVDRVAFLGFFEDVNLEGDGRYRQWHYHYARSKLKGHIGTAASAPWRVRWDTSWVPNQSQSFRLAAHVTDESGLTYFTPAVGGLTLDRGDLSVELCKPYDVPKRWVTRRGEMQQKFSIDGDLRCAVAAQLVWCSWSPGYMNGLSINGQPVFDREGPRYAYFVHRVPVDDLSVFQRGENRLTTGKTPKFDGKMVHGMEVNWPGVMVLIQYRNSKRL